MCISFCIVIVFLQFDLNESRLSRSSQRTSKYAPNMREPKTNEKLPQVHLTPLKLRFALKRQTVPQTEPADPQNRSASSFIVCRSLFLVRCLSSPRVVRVVLVSCSGRVLGAQHDCRNVPSSLSLSPTSLSLAASMLLLPRLSGVSPLLHSRLPR